MATRKSTRLFRSTAAKIRLGDFVAESVVNGMTSFARYRGVVETITPLSATLRDIHFDNETWVTLTDDETVWIEREYF